MYNYTNFQKKQKTANATVASNEDALASLALSQREIARQIIQIAHENNILIPHDINLTEILSVLAIAEHLPFEVYAIIARIITCIYEQEVNKS